MRRAVVNLDLLSAHRVSAEHALDQRLRLAAIVVLHALLILVARVFTCEGGEDVGAGASA